MWLDPSGRMEATNTPSRARQGGGRHRMVATQRSRLDLTENINSKNELRAWPFAVDSGRSWRLYRMTGRLGSPGWHGQPRQKQRSSFD
eukprot:g10945.t1